MELFRQLVSVVLVVALAVAAAWWFRKGMPAPSVQKWGRPGAGGRRIQIVQRAPLTAQHCLHLVRMDDREWIVATHPNGVTVLRDGRMEANGMEQTT